MRSYLFYLLVPIFRYVLLALAVLHTASLALLALAYEHTSANPEVVRDSHGAIIRGDVTTKKIALVFTGDERGESTNPILNTLAERNIKAGLFVTGNFVRNPELRPLLKRAIRDGHYLGPHSDSHPLYCDWDQRDKSLVTREFFTADLERNIDALRKLGALAKDQSVLFIPPYEWFNRDQTAWAKALGVTLINFTPGSRSNRDYAPEGDRAFAPSQKILDDILAYEQKDPHGLNGYVLLLHLGSGRKDPFHTKLAQLLDELKHRNYKFVRIDDLLSNKPASRGVPDSE